MTDFIINLRCCFPSNTLMFMLVNIVLSFIIYLSDASRANDCPLLCEHAVFQLLVEARQAQGQ